MTIDEILTGAVKLYREQKALWLCPRCGASATRQRLIWYAPKAGKAQIGCRGCGRHITIRDSHENFREVVASAGAGTRRNRGVHETIARRIGEV